jgi:hypothetical protein
MNTQVATWLLAGALAASVAWNVKDCLESDAPPVPAQAAGCAGAPDLRGLELSDSQAQAVEAWCRGSCATSCGTEQEAEAKLEALHAALRDPAATPESLRALAAEVSRARERSLSACVDAILEVRSMLTPGQLGDLMGCCTLPEPSKL